MFYLTKKSVKEIEVDDELMVLADFPGVPAGSKGVVTENYGDGVMVEWKRQRAQPWQKPLQDGFHDDELEYLAFATMRHPTKALREPASRS